MTFLPQFVSADDPHAAGKLLFLGLYFIAFSAPLAALLILGAERVIALLKAARACCAASTTPSPACSASSP